MIILELPGHGQAPAQADSGRFEGLARSLDDWLIKENFTGIDMVGISLGAGLVLEMARRGRAGSVVALDPGGFWQGWERTFFRTTITASIALVRALRPALPALTPNVTGRTGFMPQLSARPCAPDPGFGLNDTRIARVCRSRPAARRLPTRKRQCTGSSAADTSLCGIGQIKRSASFSMPRIARTLDDAAVSWLVFEKAHSRARLRAHAIFFGSEEDLRSWQQYRRA